MGEGLKRAFKAARLTRQCPVKGCRRVKAKDGDICSTHQREWDAAVGHFARMQPKAK